MTRSIIRVTMYRNSSQSGSVNPQLLVIIGLLVLVVALVGLSGWLYLQYDDQKTNVDSKIAVAEAAARKQQSEEDEVKIKAIEEEPNREFAGPEDYGRVSFEYPKNWSVYIEKDPTVNGNAYYAYLNPIIIPPTNDKSARFALKVEIENVAYDKVLEDYRKAIEKGELKSSPIKINDHEGTRLDGILAKDIRGSAVIFRVRDKTIMISTQAETFKQYFEEIIKTIDFND